MFIPGTIFIMLDIYRTYKRRRKRRSWREWTVTCAITTPLYPLFVIHNSIHTAYFILQDFLKDEYKGNIEFTKEFKMIEIIGE